MKSINQSLCIVKVKLYWSKHAFNQMHVWNKTRQIFGAWILPDKTRSAASFFTERERAQGCERNADVTSLLSTPVTVYLPSTSQAKACKSLLGFPYSKLASGCHRGLTWLCTKSLFLLRLSKQTFQMSDGECDFFCFFRCCWTRCVCASGRQEGTVSRRVKWHEKVETGQRETRRWRISFLFF